MSELASESASTRAARQLPNFPGPEAGDQLAHAYGTHAERLVAAKERYDSGRVFTRCRNTSACW